MGATGSKKANWQRSMLNAATLDGLNALAALDLATLEEAAVAETLGVLLKYCKDVQQVQAGLPVLLAHTQAAR